MNSVCYLLCLIFTFRANCDVTKGQCSVLLSNNTTDTFCCDDHEFINGYCVACDVGFSAVEKNPCLPCAYPFFGKKCGNMCSCPKERCDHVIGCIEPSTTTFMSTEFSIELSTWPIETSNEIFGLEVHPTTNQYLPRTGQHRNDRDETTENPASNTPDNTSGLLNREIAIYSICAGTFAVTCLLCTAWRHRYKRIYGYYRGHRLQSRRRINRSTPLPELPVQEIEEIYETIDESNMIDQITLNELSINVNIIRIERESPPPDDDYLIPCHHESSDMNNSEHRKTHSESDSSGSPISSIEQNATAYLNPYQPIVTTDDVHPYTKLTVSESALFMWQNNVINIECGFPSPADDYLIPCHHGSPNLNSSEHSKTPSESDLTESPISSMEQNATAYLNPYQPIISTGVHLYDKLAASDNALCLGLIQKDTNSSHRECHQQILVLDAEVHEYKFVTRRDSISARSQEKFSVDYLEPNILPQNSKLSTTPTQNTFLFLPMEGITFKNAKSCDELELNDVVIGKQNGKSDTCNVFLSGNSSAEYVVSSQFQKDGFAGSEELNICSDNVPYLELVDIRDYEIGHQEET